MLANGGTQGNLGLKLTAAQYAQGFLTWTPIEGLTIRIGTASSAAEPVTWSPPLTEPDGSILPIQLGKSIQLRYDMAGAAPIEIAKLWVALEQVIDGVVVTRVFHGFPKKPVQIRHVVGYQPYHRLVVDAGTLDWEEDVVFREMGILVRFVTGDVEGESVSDLKATVTEEGKPTLEGEQRTAKATGRFIEVVTPGRDAQHAEQQAYATLGLLALGLGGNVLGKVVFSERWEASPTEQRGESVAAGTAFARKAASEEYDIVDQLLWSMTVDGPVARARVISLRWYERGLRSTAPLDILLSFFIGIESLVSAYASAKSPIPAEQERAAENHAILERVKALGKKVLNRVAQRIRGRSIREEFAFYARQHGLGAVETSRFEKTKRVRDSAVHGDEVDVTLEVAHQAEQLLRAMLKGEFSIQGELPWEKQPRVHGMRLVFALVPTDRTGAEAAAEGAPASGQMNA